MKSSCWRRSVSRPGDCSRFRRRSPCAGARLHQGSCDRGADLQLGRLLHRPQRRRRLEPQLLRSDKRCGGPAVPREGCHNATGALAGGQVGYRWQTTNWVFGLEAQGTGQTSRDRTSSDGDLHARQSPTRPRSTRSASSPARSATPGTTCSCMSRAALRSPTTNTALDLAVPRRRLPWRALPSIGERNPLGWRGRRRH